VGHSFGGLVVRRYATTYVNEVAGLVLVDATPADLHEAQPELTDALQKEMRQQKWFSLLAPFGIIRLLVVAGFSPTRDLNYPSHIVPVLRTLISQIRFLREVYRESGNMDGVMAAVRSGGPSLVPSRSLCFLASPGPRLEINGRMRSGKGCNAMF
jgi:pimeloyl-ACP methyl ester carboxylesterase